jgi:hypothetical protein
MLSETVYSLGNPGTFDIVDKNDPQYYIARFAHEMSVNYYNLQTEGFVWRQEEDSDYSTLISSFDTYAGNLDTWFTTAVAASGNDLPIPAPPSVPALPGSSLPQILISILMRIGIRVLVDWLRKKLDSGTDAKEITSVLRKGLLLPDPSNGEISILELLASAPLKIMINKNGEFSDFAFTSDP